jgi:hypothetical protein
VHTHSMQQHNSLHTDAGCQRQGAPAAPPGMAQRVGQDTLRSLVYQHAQMG